MDDRQAISEHGAWFGKIVHRVKAGKKLTPEERSILGAGTGETSGAGAEPRTSYDSLQAAAAALGIPKETLQFAKEQGAPGFKGSRVYPLELIPWLSARTQAQPGQPGQLLNKRQLECQVLQKKIEEMVWEQDQKRNLWILKSDVDSWMVETAEQIKAILRNRLKNELPPKLEGLRAPEIAAKMDSLIAEIVDLIREPGRDLGR